MVSVAVKRQHLWRFIKIPRVLVYSFGPDVQCVRDIQFYFIWWHVAAIPFNGIRALALLFYAGVLVCASAVYFWVLHSQYVRSVCHIVIRRVNEVQSARTAMDRSGYRWAGYRACNQTRRLARRS